MGFLGDLFDSLIFPEEYNDLGKAGERFTYRALKNEFLRSQVFRNVYLKKSDGNYTEIDLITVGSKGIYVFESKNYSGWIFGNDQQKEWTQCLPNGVKIKFHNPVWQNSSHIKCLMHNLKQFPNIKYYSFIVFSKRCELKKIECATPDTYIIKRNELSYKLDKVKSEQTDTILNEEMQSILKILSNAQRPDQEIKDQHLEDLQRALSTCPRCKNVLIERKNKSTGEIFYGCQSYPKCKYTTKEIKKIKQGGNHAKEKS